MLSNQDTLIQRIHRELLDISDEELELELSEDGHNLDALFDEPVSYTHLTLPTNREV